MAWHSSRGFVGLRTAPHVGLALAVAVAWVVPRLAHAQARGVDAGLDAGSFRQWVDHDPFAHDDDEVSRAIAAQDGGAPDPLASGTALTPAAVADQAVPVTEGGVLTAVAGVREVSHRMHVRLESGLAIVEEELRFENSARFPSEVRYRLGVPAGAWPVGLTLDDGAHVVEAAPSAPTTEADAYDRAIATRGAEASALGGRLALDDESLVISAAALEPRGALTLRVRYAVPTPIRGNALRIVWPERPADARIGPRSMGIEAIDMVDVRVGTLAAEEELSLTPSSPIVLTAMLPRTFPARIERVAVSDGGRDFSWTRAVGARSTPSDREVVLVLDASPSTEGVGLARELAAALALISALPPSTLVHLAAFAARARTSTAPVRADAIDDALLHDFVGSGLGASTSFESLAPWIATTARRGQRWLLIGDGALRPSPASDDTITALTRRGVTLTLVNASDRPVSAEVAELAARDRIALLDLRTLRVDPGSNDAAERARVGALLADIGAATVSSTATAAMRTAVRGPALEALRDVRDGSDGVVESMGTRRVPATLRARSIGTPSPAVLAAIGARARGVTTYVHAPAALRRPRLAAVVRSGVSTTSAGSSNASGSNSGSPVAGSPAAGNSAAGGSTAARSSGTGSPSEDRTGAAMGADALLYLLRQRLMAPATQCFRDDRRGRAAYSTRTVLDLELGDREVLRASASGGPASLRACLLETLDRLEVPTFDGVVRVHWPLYTAPETPPPVMSLDARTSRALREALGDDRSGPLDLIAPRATSAD